VARAQLRVIGVDSAVEMLRLARKSVPGALLVLGDITEVEFADGSFAAVVAWDSLFHVDRRHQDMYLKFARWLRPGGRALLFTSVGTAHEGFTSPMLGEEFF
jgi:ubiquinone/menaquinone biosynthesis C-methylase UbiE